MRIQTAPEPAQQVTQAPKGEAATVSAVQAIQSTVASTPRAERVLEQGAALPQPLLSGSTAFAASQEVEPIDIPITGGVVDLEPPVDNFYEMAAGMGLPNPLVRPKPVPKKVPQVEAAQPQQQPTPKAQANPSSSGAQVTEAPKVELPAQAAAPKAAPKAEALVAAPIAIPTPVKVAVKPEVTKESAAPKADVPKVEATEKA